MRSLFIITAQMDEQQLDNSYLLCLAMLNFEHEVHVLFVDQAFVQLSASAAVKKKWLALKLYGVKQMYQLQTGTPMPPSAELTTIDWAAYESLKNNMDLIS